MLFPMVGNLLSVVLNIILDLIFICVFDMGITGAALASDFGDFTVCLVDGNFFILPLMFGNIGLWLSFVVAEIICVVVSYVCLRKTMQKWSINQ